MRIEQDGAHFYDADTGQLVWSAPFRVRDFDVPAAQRARAAFKEWAREAGVDVSFL